MSTITISEYLGKPRYVKENELVQKAMDKITEFQTANGPKSIKQVKLTLRLRMLNGLLAISEKIVLSLKLSIAKYQSVQFRAECHPNQASSYSNHSKTIQ